jgi:hypothetical protein
MTHIWHREKATNLHITQHIPYLYSILNSLNDKFLIYQNPFLTTNKLINFSDTKTSSKHLKENSGVYSMTTSIHRLDNIRTPKIVSNS